jgi:hypothetical protein
MTEELDALLPIHRVVTVGTEQIEVKPYKFGQLNKVIKAAEPLFVHLKQINVDGSPEEVGGRVLQTVLTNGGDSLTTIIALSIGKSSDWVENLELDEVVELASAVFEVNKDFFTKKIAPLLAVVINRK